MGRVARPSQNLIAEFEAAARAAFGELGFKRRKYGVLVLPRTAGLSAWVGLNKATETAGGLLEVNALVGAHHREVEDAWAKFARREPTKPNVPTVRVHIGYLMPENDYHPWFFADGEPVHENVRDIVDKIESFGMPWVDRLSDKDELVAAIDRRGIGDERARRLPVALWLAGRSDEGRAVVLDELDRIDGQANPAADVYRGFAENFLREI
jgi:hypothetical protein